MEADDEATDESYTYNYLDLMLKVSDYVSSAFLGPWRRTQNERISKIKLIPIHSKR